MYSRNDRKLYSYGNSNLGRKTTKAQEIRETHLILSLKKKKIEREYLGRHF